MGDCVTGRLCDGGTKEKKGVYLMAEKIHRHTDLVVYKLAFETACQIFELTKISGGFYK